PADPLERHDVARAEPPPAHLDHEIGAPREETPIGAEGGAQLDRLGERGRRVVFEAHPLPRDPAGRLVRVRREMTIRNAAGYCKIETPDAPSRAVVASLDTREDRC